MKKHLFIFIILLASMLLFAQSEIDSLQLLLAKHNTVDTVKVKLLNDIAYNYYRNSDYEKQLNFAQKANKLAIELGYKKGEIVSLRYIGYYYQTKSDYTLALEYHQKALKVSKEIDDKKEVARLYGGIGIIHFNQDDYPKALEYYQNALKIFEEIGDKKGISSSSNNIGLIYANIGDDPIALEYFQNALKISEEIGDKRVASSAYNNTGTIYLRQGNYSMALEYFQKGLKISRERGDKRDSQRFYNNIGTIYNAQSNFSKALEYYQKSLKISEEIGDKNGISTAYNNIGLIYNQQGEYINALEYYQKALKIFEEIGQKNQIALCNNGIATVFLNQNKYKKAYNYSKKAFIIAQEIGNAETIINTSETYVESCKALELYKEAFDAHVVFKTMSDSLFNEENIKKITATEYKYKYEIEQEKKDAINIKEKEKQAAVRNWIIAAFFLMMLLAFYIYRSYRIKLKSNLILRNQKSEIQDKNKQLKTLADQLQQMDQVKSNFFANISHEFRTPLTLVISPLKKLLDDSKYPSLRKTFNLMLRSAQRQLTLVDQLMDLSKIEIKKMKLQASLASLNKFTKVMISSFHSLAEERDIHLNFIEEEKDIEIYFDVDKLHKIISNLLSNALKFTLAGGKVEIIVSTQLNKGRNRRVAEITVRDTGVGISADQLPHVFDRFYQADSSDIVGINGLIPAKAPPQELVELHHGEIMVKSKKNMGTEFIVHLPLGKDHLAEDEIIDTSIEIKHLIYDFEDSSPNIESESLQSQKVVSKTAPIILVVEDNKDMRHYIGESLYGTYNLIEAEDGEQGFHQAVKHLPNLIISDVMMPGIGGFELTKKLKQDIRTSHIPVILLTAKAGEESKIEGLETGADAYVHKPFNTKELLVRAKNLIEQRQKLREKFKKNITIDPSEVTVTSVDENFLRKAAKVVEKPIDDPEFNVDQLSKEMIMDRHNLFRKLKILINQSPSQFIRTIRLKRAAQLLKQKAAPIGEIAFMVGFEKPSYFSESFKKHFGVPPSEYGGG